MTYAEFILMPHAAKEALALELGTTVEALTETAEKNILSEKDFIQRLNEGGG